MSAASALVYVTLLAILLMYFRSTFHPMDSAFSDREQRRHSPALESARRRPSENCRRSLGFPLAFSGMESGVLIAECQWPRSAGDVEGGLYRKPWQATAAGYLQRIP